MTSLMHFVNRTARCFTLYRNNRLEDKGINGYQHLYIIKICKHPGILQDELVREIYVNKSSVARQLSLLEQNGFIRRIPYPDDRRQLMVYPTEKAVAVYPEVLAVREAWNGRLLEEFSEEEKALLLSMMERVSAKAVELLPQPKQSEGDERGK